MKINQAIAAAAKQISGSSPTPILDSELLVACAINQERNYLYSYPEKILNKGQERLLKQLISYRKKFWPMAYILGYKEFYGLNFIVDKTVLIPRPDTELIVDEVIKHHQNNKIIMDVGTGSGCIAVAIKKCLPHVKMLASDISKSAVTTAKKNAKLNKVAITFYCSDLLKSVPKAFYHKIDTFVFNPPYLTKNEARKKSLKFEPQVALTPDNFLSIITDFLEQSKKFITANGIIIMEMGHKQGKLIKKIVNKIYPDKKILIRKDLGNYERLIKIY